MPAPKLIDAPPRGFAVENEGTISTSAPFSLLHGHDGRTVVEWIDR